MADGALQNQMPQKNILLIVNVNPKLQIIKSGIRLHSCATFYMNHTYVHAVGLFSYTSAKNLLI